MKNFTVQISDAEEKALLACYDEGGANMVDIQTWVQNAISNRARQAIDGVVEKHTDKNYKKLDRPTKEQIVMNTTLKTAIERQAEFDASLGV